MRVATVHDFIRIIFHLLTPCVTVTEHIDRPSIMPPSNISTFKHRSRFISLGRAVSPSHDCFSFVGTVCILSSRPRAFPLNFILDESMLYT